MSENINIDLDSYINTLGMSSRRYDKLQKIAHEFKPEKYTEEELRSIISKLYRSIEIGSVDVRNEFSNMVRSLKISLIKEYLDKLIII